MREQRQSRVHGDRALEGAQTLRWTVRQGGRGSRGCTEGSGRETGDKLSGAPADQLLLLVWCSPSAHLVLGDPQGLAKAHG